MGWARQISRYQRALKASESVLDTIASKSDDGQSAVESELFVVPPGLVIRGFVKRTGRGGAFYQKRQFRVGGRNLVEDSQSEASNARYERTSNPLVFISYAIGGGIATPLSLVDSQRIPSMNVLARKGDEAIIDYLSLSGLRSFPEPSKLVGEVESGAAVWDAISSQIAESNISVIIWDRALPAKWPVLPTVAKSASASEETARDVRKLDWIHSPEEILRRLEDHDSHSSELFNAVLFAETAAFRESDRSRLQAALSAFISKYRFAVEKKPIAIVGSAVRKYAMNMRESEFEDYSQWLSPNETKTLHHEVELELVKGACWRLQYLAVRGRIQFPKLRKCLADLSQEYLSRRLILQKNYAATAMSAIAAVAILDGIADQNETSAGLLRRVAEIDVKWFSELVEDQITEAIDSINGHDSNLASRLRLWQSSSH